MADDADTQQLVQSVDRSAKFLTDIKATFARHFEAHEDVATPWIREIEQVEAKYKPSRGVIGVVGATGAGKSSLINAILGETQLVPTSCMRACTAVVTEIAYNHDTTSDYRAVIEFISRQEWHDELRILFEDVTSRGKVTINVFDDDSPASIAFSKVQAVYPHLHERNLPKTNIDDLLDSDFIKDVAGTEIEFSTSTAEELHAKIRRYIDSEGTTLTPDLRNHGLPASSTLDAIAYWPLVRTIRIYTKASVLAAGSVLVDLPGVDSNAARTAIARKHLQNCSGLWVVAPITRAVDKNSARRLMGEGFKPQLWRDGPIQQVTFIYSKTDEISVSETRVTLQRYPALRVQLEAIDKDRTNALSQRDDLRRSLSQITQEIERVSTLHKESVEEEAEYKKLGDNPQAHPLVRVEATERRLDEEVPNMYSTSNEHARYGSHMTATSESPNMQNPSPSYSVAPVSQVQFREDMTQPQLTSIQIKNKLQSLKSIKRESRTQKKDLKATAQALKQDVLANKAEIDNIGAREWIACVLARNDISSRAVRVNFAAGAQVIAENENDNSAEEDNRDVKEDTFEAHKVSQVGFDALPVFCISTRGYYQTSHLMEDERITTCFSTQDQTGIPALRDHAYKLGNDKRLATLQAFEQEVQRLLTSLRLWLANDRVSSPVDRHTAGGSEDVGRELVDTSMTGTSSVAINAMETASDTMKSEVLAILLEASKSASNEALSTSTR